MATKRELYEATEYIEKMDLMIAKLRTTKPGELAGKVGKKEILMMRRDSLQQLINDGYTAAQIAEAMKNDVFGILPKTITELTSSKATKKKTTRKVTSALTNTEQNKKLTDKLTPVAGAPAAGSKATFEIKPDTRDL